MFGHEPKLKRERPTDRQEQVAKHANQGEKDLLNGHAGENTSEAGRSDDRGEHQQHHQGAEIRWQD